MYLKVWTGHKSWWDEFTMEIKTIRHSFWQWEQLHIFVAVNHYNEIAWRRWLRLFIAQGMNSDPSDKIEYGKI